eukprot:Selendium_serpulae@DN6161_c0_g2_i3.p1
MSAEAVDTDEFEDVEAELRNRMADIMKRDGEQAVQGMFTSPTDESDELFTQEKYEVGAAVGWGGAQEIDNVYEISPNYDASICHTATFPDPQDGAFWSVTVYNEKGFLFSDAANLNSYGTEPNPDGTFTVSFGCGPDAVNNIETENASSLFNVAVRHYRPSQAVRDGEIRVVRLIQEAEQEEE